MFIKQRYLISARTYIQWQVHSIKFIPKKARYSSMKNCWKSSVIHLRPWHIRDSEVRMSVFKFGMSSIWAEQTVRIWGRSHWIGNKMETNQFNYNFVSDYVWKRNVVKCTHQEMRYRLLEGRESYRVALNNETNNTRTKIIAAFHP